MNKELAARLREWLKENAPDCGDNSCLFGGHGKGGMRTNGGCRCYKDVLPDKRRIYIERMQAALEASASNDHIGFARYEDYNGRRATTIDFCDSDTPGAFKVYRAPALESQEGWVSVKDRLPENFGMRCLVMGTEADTPTSANWNGLTDGSQQYWILDNANVQWTIELVSHWMPLPAAPKGKP